MTDQNKLDEYIYRFHVKLNGSRTSVSLDTVLVQLMMKKLKTRETLLAWIQAEADKLSFEFRDAKPSAGYSRILQQRAILLIADPALVIAQ
jgi:hypothetical protein